MERFLYQRIVSASVASAALVGGVWCLILGTSTWSKVLALLGGNFTLGLAHLLRAASSLRRSVALPTPSLRSAVLASLAILATVATTFLLLAFGGDEEPAGSPGMLGFVLGIITQARFCDRCSLLWAPFPREPAHRRVKCKLFGLIVSTTTVSCFALFITSWLDGQSFGGQAWEHLFAAAGVLLASEIHLEALEDCTSLSMSDLPDRADLLQGLLQPLSIRGNGLGRWMAHSVMAQAVAFRPQGPYPGIPAGADIGLSLGSSHSGIVPFATEVFCADQRAPRQGLAPAWNDGSSGFADPAIRQASLYPLFLKSSLEVLKEFTIRLECASGAATVKGPQRLGPTQWTVLEESLVELAPLVRLAVAGLAGWICISRDFDQVGVVQREESLSKALHEICGLFMALDTACVLRGADLSPTAALALQRVQAEVKMSLLQLLVTFKNAGLDQVSLPPSSQRLVEGLRS